MSQPLISIIVPTYNRAALLHIALDSILAQTYSNWECCVIDDGSTDDSLSVLQFYHRKDPRIRIFTRDRLPKGAPTCRNIGLSVAHGEYVIFLDSDDYLLPICLEARLSALNRCPHCDVLVFPIAEKRDGTLVKRTIDPDADHLAMFLSANLPWHTMSPLWSRPFLVKINGFTEGYPRFNDPELMIRALLRPGIQYKLFPSNDYDAVHVPSPKFNLEFKEKVRQSLYLFIPDISRHLMEAGKDDYRHKLAFYLHLWFRYIQIPSRSSAFGPSAGLIRLFAKHKVIPQTKALSLYVRLLIHSISSLVLKRPIDKISERALYRTGN